MRIFIPVFIALLLWACGEDNLVHISDENHEIVFIAVNAKGRVFLSESSAPIAIGELPQKIEELLETDKDYSFVIQSENGSGPMAESVNSVLQQQGVKEKHVAIAQIRP